MGPERGLEPGHVPGRTQRGVNLHGFGEGGASLAAVTGIEEGLSRCLQRFCLLKRPTGIGITLRSREQPGAILVQQAATVERIRVPVRDLRFGRKGVGVACEGLRSTNNHASWSVDEEDVPDALLAARVVTAYASRQMLGVTETAMQMYGGIGQTWEHIAHFYARRVLLNRYLLGDAQLQLAAIADRRLERLSPAAS